MQLDRLVSAFLTTPAETRSNNFGGNTLLKSHIPCHQYLTGSDVIAGSFSSSDRRIESLKYYSLNHDSSSPVTKTAPHYSSSPVTTTAPRQQICFITPAALKTQPLQTNLRKPYVSSTLIILPAPY